MSEGAREAVRDEAGDSGESVRSRIASVPTWYHTMELAPGVVTPGWFDLRPIVDRMPWPDVRGKRCLDVGPWDGFLSFELERRGAAEVVATDIPSPAEWDLLAYRHEERVAALLAEAGENGAGFRVARELLGSQAERVEISIYDLSPERLGTFDVVVCGTLLLHLRDPIRGLEAMRSVCDGWLLSAEQVRAGLSLIGRGRPMAAAMAGDNGQWWVSNVAGHRKMVRAAGFEIERTTRPYAIPFGPGHPRGRGGSIGRRIVTRLATGGAGVPHAALLATPLP